MESSPLWLEEKYGSAVQYKREDEGHEDRYLEIKLYSMHLKIVVIIQRLLLHMQASHLASSPSIENQKD